MAVAAQAAARTGYNPRPPTAGRQHRMTGSTNPIILMNTSPESALREAVESYVDPYLGLELRAAGALRSLQVDDERVQIALALGFPARRYRDELAAAIEQQLRPLAGKRRVVVDVEWQVAPHATAGKLRPIQGIRNIIAVASGKGGVGKSSVTVNLAAAMAQSGLSVGVVDADIYGFSVPRMLGTEQRPTQVDDMILPPIAHDVKLISIGMFVPGNQPVVWRGPMLHRALQQFLGDVFWGDLDVLLLDLPPGTGDIAISVAQLIPNAEILIVTTPQTAAAEVAERAGSIALQTHQRIAGVIENMSWLELPDGTRHEVFGAGGGQAVADSLTRAVGAPVPLLGQIPLDTRLREGGDAGMPIVLSDPDSPSAVVLKAIASGLSTRARGLAGRSLGLTPAGR